LKELEQEWKKIIQQQTDWKGKEIVLAEEQVKGQLVSLEIGLTIEGLLSLSSYVPLAHNLEHEPIYTIGKYSS